jgi:hypothetical protein
LPFIENLLGQHGRKDSHSDWTTFWGADQEGWRVNRKRVWRLWKQEGLKVPQKQVKKRRIGNSDNGIVRRMWTSAQALERFARRLAAADAGSAAAVPAVPDASSRSDGIRRAEQILKEAAI